ncbi:MAG: 1-aminocyclopropane-1-carboxylate deaminase [Acidimicrobiales bacterium]|nr:MAG: 1-aminocyclopropane-1-carboxylate deaminase [Acidimicrobiales bacterium]
MIALSDIETTLAAFPRVALGHWPTPLEPTDRLRAERGGPRIWLKRDDCSGLAFGGDKTRKLEFLLGEALTEGATGVMTFGALQSNHCRQTAAASARVGLPCHLILTTQVERDDAHYVGSGNRLLDDVLGATVHVVADNDAALVRCGELLDADPGLAVIGPGGSSPVGTLGYVAAGIELAAQLRDAAVDPAAVVVASSTGGTAAGLLVGLEMGGAPAPVRAVAVYADAATTRATIEYLAAETASLVSAPAPNLARLTVDDSMLGAGYGIETDASHAAVDVLARTEGVLLDPVYTAKAFAFLLASSEIDTDDDVVFVHTGGQTGLFAYADAFASTS